MSSSKSTSTKRHSKNTSPRGKAIKPVSSKETITSKETLSEKGPRLYRNVNIAVGSLALAGALITPPLIAAGLGVYAAFNFAQAAAGEGVLRYVRGRKKKKAKLTQDSKQ